MSSIQKYPTDSNLVRAGERVPRGRPRPFDDPMSRRMDRRWMRWVASYAASAKVIRRTAERSARWSGRAVMLACASAALACVPSASAFASDAYTTQLPQTGIADPTAVPQITPGSTPYVPPRPSASTRAAAPGTAARPPRATRFIVGRPTGPSVEPEATGRQTTTRRAPVAAETAQEADPASFLPQSELPALRGGTSARLIMERRLPSVGRGTVRR